MPFSHIFTLEVDMIKQVIGTAVLGAAIFGAPAAASAAEASTLTPSSQTVVAGCDNWCGHGHHHYRHHHHGYYGHGYRHYGYPFIQTGGINAVFAL